MNNMDSKKLFKISAIIWIVMLIVNAVIFMSFKGEGYFSELGMWQYLWLGINFVPLTILFIYVNISKSEYSLKVKSHSSILKFLIAIFGILCLISLYSSQFVETETFKSIFKFSPFVFLLVQMSIWYYLPKPKKIVNPLKEKDENIALLNRKIEALRKELIITSSAEVKFEMETKIEDLEKELAELKAL